MKELIHTSVPRTLSGSSGYGVVAQTEGFPRRTARTLVNNSGYQFPKQNAERGPTLSSVLFAHWSLPTEEGGHHVLTRITPCGFDQSGRPNRLAHHLLIETHDLSSIGPACIARQYNWISEWPGPPQLLKQNRLPQDSNHLCDSELNISQKIIHDSTNAAIGRERGIILHLEEGQDPLEVLSTIELETDPSSRWAMKWAINTPRSFSSQLRNLILSVPGNPAEEELNQLDLIHCHISSAETTPVESTDRASFGSPENTVAPMRITGKKYTPPSDLRKTKEDYPEAQEVNINEDPTTSTTNEPEIQIPIEPFEVRISKDTKDQTKSVIALLITALALALLAIILIKSSNNITDEVSSEIKIPNEGVIP